MTYETILLPLPEKKDIYMVFGNISLLIYSSLLMSFIGLLPLLVIKQKHFEHLRSEEAIRVRKQPQTNTWFVMIQPLSGYFFMYFIEISTKYNENKTNKKEGYCNLLANLLDNLAHGIALTGAYSLGVKTGLFTTLSLIMHEIPHEAKNTQNQPIDI
ncbi:hypothetical protein HZS_1616 [Henneguya salminicola]|nr:hypothetical protein HZS_1616 [Henneguya salminicola]